jgi:hypothetical protein
MLEPSSYSHSTYPTCLLKIIVGYSYRQGSVDYMSLCWIIKRFFYEVLEMDAWKGGNVHESVLFSKIPNGSCSLLYFYRLFGWTWCLHFPSTLNTEVTFSSGISITTIRLNGSITPKTTFWGCIWCGPSVQISNTKFKCNTFSSYVNEHVGWRLDVSTDWHTYRNCPPHPFICVFCTIHV